MTPVFIPMFIPMPVHAAPVAGAAAAAPMPLAVGVLAGTLVGVAVTGTLFMTAAAVSYAMEGPNLVHETQGIFRVIREVRAEHKAKAAKP